VDRDREVKKDRLEVIKADRRKGRLVDRQADGQKTDEKMDITIDRQTK
jgi:hypothetical protein